MRTVLFHYVLPLFSLIVFFFCYIALLLSLLLLALSSDCLFFFLIKFSELLLKHCPEGGSRVTVLVRISLFNVLTLEWYKIIEGSSWKWNNCFCQMYCQLCQIKTQLWNSTSSEYIWCTGNIRVVYILHTPFGCGLVWVSCKELWYFEHRYAWPSSDSLM